MTSYFMSHDPDIPFQLSGTIVVVEPIFWLSNVQRESASVGKDRKMILAIGELTIYHCVNQSGLDGLCITVGAVHANAIYKQRH